MRGLRVYRKSCTDRWEAKQTLQAIMMNLKLIAKLIVSYIRIMHA